jgi:hypothetical protein
MNLRLSYLLLLLLPALMVTCTDELSEIQRSSFIKFYGSFLNDAGRDVKALPSGGYAIAGTIVPDSVAKMVLIITDEAGNQVEGSPFYFGGQYRTAGNTLLVLDDGFLLGGNLADTASDGEIQTDIYLVRTDVAGNELWSRKFGEDEDDDLYHVIRRKSGGYVLAGKKTTDEDENLWIIMVDDDGQMLYEFTGRAIDDDDEANFLIATPNGYLCACSYDDGALDGTDLFLVHIDEECGLIDTRVMGTDDDDMARTIVKYNDGYLLMGYTENTATGLNEIQVYTFSLLDNLIRDVRKLATISEPGADLTGEDCVINSRGEIAIVGTREANENRNIYLVLLDNEGNIIEEPGLFGGSGNQAGRAIDNAADGGMIITGSSSQGGNTLITLIKTDARGGL